MEASTLEQYFIEDYKKIKAENEELKEQLHQYEANSNHHEFGITDLQQRTKAVKGSLISSYYLMARLKDGKLKLDRAKKWLNLTTDEIIKKLNGISLYYTTVLSFEVHEFQYTLFVKESRTEWTAVSDGKKGSSLIQINSGEFCEDTWFSIDEIEPFKHWLASNFKEIVEETIDDYEKWKAEQETVEEAS